MNAARQLTIDEAASQYRVSRRWLNDQVRGGRLTAFGSPRRRTFQPDLLQREMAAIASGVKTPPVEDNDDDGGVDVGDFDLPPVDW
jgi:hypothetical protein